MVFYFFVVFYLISDGLPRWGWPLFALILVWEVLKERAAAAEEVAWKQTVLRLLADINAHSRGLTGR